MTKLLCVVGPTASGKTALAVELALRFGGEVVSCDSMQVYRGMDIGTAKPTMAERRGVPHHMLDVCGPDEPFSAGLYARQASACVGGILSRGRFPIVCGGTGLYLRALAGGLADIPPCPRLNHGPGAYERLKLVDPETAARLSPNDRLRVFRALDVYAATGTPLSRFHANSPAPAYDLKCVRIDVDRAELYARIDERVDDMLRRGLAGEVGGLLAAGVSRSVAAMQGLGYKEIAAHLAGESTLEEAREAIQSGTRRYAKRQITWFVHQTEALPLAGNIFTSAETFVANVFRL